MEPEVLKSILTAVVIGLGAGFVLRLLRQFVTGRKFGLWLILCAVVDGAYLVTAAAVGNTGTFGMKLFLAAAVMFTANALLQLMNVLIWDYLLRQRRQVSIPRLVIDIVNFVLLAIVAVSILKSVFQVNLNALLVTSTVVSAVVGLSLQDVLGSVVAGLALQMEKPFGVGDWVETEGEEGVVTQMSWRTVSIRTRTHSTIIVPNSNVTKQLVRNFSRLSPFQLRLPVGIAYGHPPGLVKSVLLGAVRESGAALDDPPPEVLLKSFDDFSMGYEIRFWAVDYSRKMHMLDAVASKVWYALRRTGVEIPFPVRDVTVRMLPEDFEARQAEREVEAVFGELRRIHLFDGLSDSQMASLAAEAAMLRYAEGESLVRQGEQGDSMFLVKSGSLRVDLRTGAGRTTTVARLGPGDFFGEMSLLTGEPRTASVIADTETEVIRVRKADFAEIIVADPSTADLLSAALELRMRELQEKSSKASVVTEEFGARTRADILSRIRGFFGI